MSVDKSRNVFGSAFVSHDEARKRREASYMVEAPFVIDTDRRAVVHGAILEVCRYRDWELQALNVCTNHVHVVITATQPPEKAMADLKAWATRRLRDQGCYSSNRSPRTHHGSTRYLWNQEDFEAACRYVVDGQGMDLPGAPASVD